MKIPWQVTYLQNVIFPYIWESYVHEINLPADYLSLLLLDYFSGQFTETLLKVIDDKNISTANYSSKLHRQTSPLDLIINKAVSTFLKIKFHNWHAKEIFTQIEEKCV